MIIHFIVAAHLECVLIGPIRAKDILTPPTDKASAAGKSLKNDLNQRISSSRVSTNLSMVRQTDCSDVIILLNLDFVFELDNCQVVEEVT